MLVPLSPLARLIHEYHVHRAAGEWFVCEQLMEEAIAICDIPELVQFLVSYRAEALRQQELQRPWVDRYFRNPRWRKSKLRKPDREEIEVPSHLVRPGL